MAAPSFAATHESDPSRSEQTGWRRDDNVFQLDARPGKTASPSGKSQRRDMNRPRDSSKIKAANSQPPSSRPPEATTAASGQSHTPISGSSDCGGDGGENSGWIRNGNIDQLGAQASRQGISALPSGDSQRRAVNLPRESKQIEGPHPRLHVTPANSRTNRQPHATPDSTRSRMGNPDRNFLEDPFVLLGITPLRPHTQVDHTTHLVEDRSEAYPRLPDVPEAVLTGSPPSTSANVPCAVPAAAATHRQTATAVSHACGSTSPGASVAGYAASMGAFTTRKAVLLLLLITCIGIRIYQRMSTNIGFCDAGRTTNPALLGLREQVRTTGIFGLKAQVGATGDATDSGATDARVAFWEVAQAFLTSLVPDSCTPCPSHSICTRSTATCERGFIIAPHEVMSLVPFDTNMRSSNMFSQEEGMRFQKPPAWLAYTLISVSMDGLPGVGPYALPPRCVEDTEWARRMRVIRKEVVEILSSERGRRVCHASDETLRDGEVTGSIGEARRWGMEIHSLETAVERRLPVSTRRYVIGAPNTEEFLPSFRRQPDWLSVLHVFMDDLAWDEQPTPDLLRERDHR